MDAGRLGTKTVQAPGRRVPRALTGAHKRTPRVRSFWRLVTNNCRGTRVKEGLALLGCFSLLLHVCSFHDKGFLGERKASFLSLALLRSPFLMLPIQCLCLGECQSVE